MSNEAITKEIEAGNLGSSLIYDTDAISLIGRFTDELSAYRSRRNWIEVLSNHFLLESERDFELKIIASDTSGSFLLSCSFISACGRYAFWRLINHQAPEAEEKMADQSAQPSSIKSSLGLGSSESEGPWVLAGGITQPIRRKRSVKDMLLEMLGK